MRSAFLESFTTFDSTATFNQKQRMESLKKRLKKLGPNPLSFVNERFDIADEIVTLRAVANATITAEMIRNNLVTR